MFVGTCLWCGNFLVDGTGNVPVSLCDDDGCIKQGQIHSKCFLGGDCIVVHATVSLGGARYCIIRQETICRITGRRIEHGLRYYQYELGREPMTLCPLHGPPEAAVAYMLAVATQGAPDVTTA